MTSTSRSRPCTLRLAGAMLIMLAFATAALAFAPARSDAYIFWTQGSGSSIGRASLDGSNANPSFIGGSGSSYDVAVQGDFVYWSSNSGSSIGRAGLDGSGVQPLFLNATNTWYLATTENSLYWTTVTGAVNRFGPGPGELVNGLIPGSGRVGSVAVSPTHIYWSDSGTTGSDGKIGRADLDGTNRNPDFITGLSDPRGIAVSGSHIYWASFGAKSVGRANLDGSGQNEAFIAGSSQVIDVAVDESRVYWTNAESNSIGRAGLDGTAVNQSFIATTAAPGGIAVGPDKEPPGLEINSGPSGQTNVNSPNFTFTAEAGSTVTCSVDQGTPAFGPCISDSMFQPSSPLADGEYTFRVRAADQAANATVRTRSFTVDTAAPDTTILLGPDNPAAADPDVTFIYAASEQGGSFQCRLDGAPWASCPESKQEYAGLASGPHTFGVRATDQAGNTDPTPASSTFTVKGGGSPSGSFSFAGVKTNRKTGTATLRISVPRAGKVSLVGSKNVSAASRSAAGQGVVSLRVRVKGPAARTLGSKGRVRVKLTVRYVPSGEGARTKSTTVTLVKKRS